MGIRLAYLSTLYAGKIIKSLRSPDTETEEYHRSSRRFAITRGGRKDLFSQEGVVTAAAIDCGDQLYADLLERLRGYRTCRRIRV